MPQELRIIPLRGKHAISEAVATGNNAAWLCPCKRGLPLIGRSGLSRGITEGLTISCPDCQRKFFVVPDGKDYGSAIYVDEL